jgi:hypothetical protein
MCQLGRADAYRGVVTEGIARLENIVRFARFGGVVVGNASTSAVRRKYWDEVRTCQGRAIGY